MMRTRLRQHGRTHRRGFVLLEVMVAVLILGIAMVALMRGFFMSLDQISRIRRAETGILLSKSMLDDLMLVPAEEGRFNGKFTDDPRYGEAYEGWAWEVEIEAAEPRYDERPKGNITQSLENYYLTQIRIYQQIEGGTSRNRQERVLVNELHTILVEADVFALPAIQGNHFY